MRKLMVLAAGLLQISVIKKAREMGYYVIAVDDDPNAPGMALADKAIVPSGLMNEEKMVAIAKEEHIDGVIHPCSEVAMNVMGRINDELGLCGISKEIAIRATNKHLMREAFEKYGAPSPKSILTRDEEDAWLLFNNDFDTNAILKPSRNSGSRGIAKVEKGISKDEFVSLYHRALDESRDHQVLIEQFIEGPEFSVEVIVWQGVPHVLAVTDKKTTEAPYFVELGHNQPSLFPDDVQKKLKAGAIAGCKALGLTNCAAHCELKVQNGEAYLMEIGARMGGDFISTELTHLSSGIDMVAASINVVLGVEPDLTPKEPLKGACIRYFTPEPGVVTEVKEKELREQERVYDAEIYVKPGDMVKEVQSSLDRSGHVIVADETVQSAINQADNLVGGGTLYQDHEDSKAKQRKIMVLGASYLQSFIIKKIQEMGCEAIALDGNPECESKDLADKFYHCNIVDREGVLKIAKEERIDGIMTYASDVAAPVVSYVAEELGLPANPLKSVTILTDKGLTRKFMEEHGFNVPKSQQVLSIEEARTAADLIGYPVFIKPVDSNGSKGCSRVISEECLEDAFKYAQDNSRTKRVIVEKFIVRKGYQIDADCFMYNGELVFFHPMDQHQDPLAPYSPIGISAPSVQSKEKSDIAFNEVRRLLQLLNMRFGEYNVEYVFDENDNLYIIEIGPRSGGNLIPDVILESAGLDLRELNIKATLGEDISSFPFNEYHFTNNVTSFIIHSQETGTFKSVDIDEKLKESILFQHMFIKDGTEVHKFTGGIYALGFALVKFDTQNEMLEFIDNSSKYYKIIVK